MKTIFLLWLSVALSAFAGKTMQDVSGDGVIAPFVQVSVQLPDSGYSVLIEGSVKAIGSSLVTITGSPLTAPTAPGSGSNYWIIQVDQTSGAASIKTSTTGFPTPDANAIQVFQQQETVTDTTLSQDVTSDTPQEW